MQTSRCRRFLFFILPLFILVTCQNGELPPDLMVIQGGNLVDGTGREPVSNAVIVIKGDRIQSVFEAGEMDLPESAQVIDAAGKTILPGLIDAHIHYRDYSAELFLAHGITTVRDGGNPVEWILKLKNLSMNGAVRGPRLFAVGNQLDAPPPRRSHHLAVGTPAEARAQARDFLGRGTDGVKVYQKITPELLKAIADEVHHHGKRVAGHLGFSAKEAATLGIDVLEHASGVALAMAGETGIVESVPGHEGVFGFRFLNRSKMEDLIQVLVQEQVSIVPALSNWAWGATRLREKFHAEAVRLLKNPGLGYAAGPLRERVSAYRHPELSVSERETYEADYRSLRIFLKEFHGAGGKIVAGTDNGIVHGLSLHHELELLVDVGLSPMEAISAATLDAAEFLQQAENMGTVSPGKLADLVIVNGDPLQDITQTKQVDTVILRGKIQDTNYHAEYKTSLPRPVPVGADR